MWGVLIVFVWSCLLNSQRTQVCNVETNMWGFHTRVVFSLRSHVNNNVTMIKLQKQLADRSNAVTELQGRFLQLQEVRCVYSLTEIQQQHQLRKIMNSILTNQYLYPCEEQASAVVSDTTTLWRKQWIFTGWDSQALISHLILIWQIRVSHTESGGFIPSAEDGKHPGSLSVLHLSSSVLTVIVRQEKQSMSEETHDMSSHHLLYSPLLNNH